MVRAIGLLILLLVLQLVFDRMHPFEFLAKRVVHPVGLVSPRPQTEFQPGRSPGAAPLENPLLKDEHGKINQHLFDNLPAAPLDLPPERR